MTIENIEIIAKMMRIFQKTKNITNQCITNSQYLYDTIRYNFPHLNVKVANKIVFVQDENKMINHMVVMIDEHIIESSYDIFKIKNKKYIDNNNVPEVMKNWSNKFKKFADQMNNGHKLVCDVSYYNEQADFLELFFSFG